MQAWGNWLRCNVVIHSVFNTSSDALPMEKRGLVYGIQENRFKCFHTSFHVGVVISEHVDDNGLRWVDTHNHKNGLSSVDTRSDGTVAAITNVTCSYHIMRRSPMTPLFHPYYIEYGRDKIEFFEKLKLSHRIGYDGFYSSGYQFLILPQDFGIDIPHK